ncbi:UDP-N-acetylmuramoyl-L-alanyl-D-glutamate--2,6-diaminopimelate ligase [Melioribacteraceae bacterium 4301-Me]|uniref:UDP-N-acetylmuramoyl-L-alanyl-D-glutamate--2, 6-diaminopimelate ligase n=1 Tax=Pyranulibacter aquaticus TaxID=3163344 RepID=UPI00359B1931
MKLVELLNLVKVIQVVGKPEDKLVTELTNDSREVIKNSIFFAIKGLKDNGNKYIEEAINNGACAIVTEKDSSLPEQLFTHTNTVKIVVENSRKSFAEFSNHFFDEPSKKITLIGVTGTKGKTTTAFYIKNVFQNAGYKTGLIGTIASYIGDEKINTNLTTPQPNTINKLLKKMVQENCTHCVMEVSSIALDLHRVDYLDFNFAVFTNITSDHMDYHKTFDHYLASKKILFDMITPNNNIVYNKDDVNSSKIIKTSSALKHSYGSDEAEFKIKNIEYSLDGTSFTIEYLKKDYLLSTSLVGHFNAYNATAAFATAVVAGVEPETAIKGIAKTPQVPGRFEIVSSGAKKVIVDYSHTADSLKQALSAIQHIVKGQRSIITVFGCGGDRDRTKRPVMGKIATEMSDYVFVTSDNPRTEDPVKIIEEIVTGIKTKNYETIVDREEAIKKAILSSDPDSVILIAGKGHEDYQEINGIKYHFSDKEIAEKYLK